jgi:predicted phage-related endonuclease
MANDELRNLQQRRAEQKALLDEMLKGKTEEERLIVKQQQRYKEVLNVLKEINEQVRELKDENKIVVDNLIQQESKLKGLTGIQASLVNLDRQRIDSQQTLGSVTQDQ